MDILAATKSYEAWLRTLVPLIAPDLKLKHAAMRKELFSFLRATYYRWAQVWPDACPDLSRDPVVLAVGDLHVENFGTWRDEDGRLVWGVNDFDECYPLPFTNDLVRLMVSAWLAIDAGEMSIASKPAAAAILAGYSDCLKAGGLPFVLVDKTTALRTMARERLNTPEVFWKKMLSLPTEMRLIPIEVVHATEDELPDPGIHLHFVHRTAGLGSLGKDRFTGVGYWLGGYIVREAKALTLSACHWAKGRESRGRIYYADILDRAVRCHDPFVGVYDHWLLRRLSPDCFRIRLSALPKKRDEKKLLYSMGWETANIHLGSLKPAQLAGALKSKSSNWLHEAAKTMREETTRDWKHWRKGR